MAWRLLSLVLATAIGFVPMAPPEHVHDVDHDGQHATVAHRHAGGHGRHAAAPAGHHDGLDLDGPELAGTEPDHHDGLDSDSPDSDHTDVEHTDVEHSDALPVPQRLVTSIDDEDSVIALVTPVWTVPVLDAPDAPATAVVAWILPPEARTHAGHVDDVERLIHGPPRPGTSLRGPPVLSRL
jgi:hypothetical protein